MFPYFSMMLPLAATQREASIGPITECYDIMRMAHHSTSSIRCFFNFSFRFIFLSRIRTPKKRKKSLKIPIFILLSFDTFKISFFFVLLLWNEMLSARKSSSLSCNTIILSPSLTYSLFSHPYPLWFIFLSLSFPCHSFVLCCGIMW